MDRLNFVKVNTFTLQDPVKNEDKKKTQKTKEKEWKDKPGWEQTLQTYTQGDMWDIHTSSELNSSESKQPNLCLMDKDLSR